MRTGDLLFQDFRLFIHINDPNSFAATNQADFIVLPILLSDQSLILQM